LWRGTYRSLTDATREVFANNVPDLVKWQRLARTAPDGFGLRYVNFRPAPWFSENELGFEVLSKLVDLRRSGHRAGTLVTYFYRKGGELTVRQELIELEDQGKGIGFALIRSAIPALKAIMLIRLLDTAGVSSGNR
jgi:hypothetical protein